MDIKTSKLELVKLIVNINNQKIIEKIYNALIPDQEDFWVELSSGEKEEIKLGLNQLNAGQRIPLSKFVDNVS